MSQDESKQDETATAPPAAPSGGGLAESERASAKPALALVPVAPSKRSPPPRPRWRMFALAGLVAAGAGAAYWRGARPAVLPPSIASGQGRVETDEIDIDAKYAGRVAETIAGEGEAVKAGQVVARMDARDLEASLHKAEAQVEGARRSVEEARANVDQQKTQLTLAQQEYDRAAALVARGFATNELLDQRRQALSGAQAALTAANDLVGVAERAQEAAQHDVELDTVEIADDTLVAPREGRIQYRIANVGEVLPAGGRVYVMLDPSYVYMDIYLPTLTVGKVRIGSEARVALDAQPDAPIPGKVVFVASQAQFTPKIVETREDRDAFMFRVRVRLDPDALRGRAEATRGGMPGVAYVKLDPAAPWPPQLLAPATP
jgi:HlyD family secretion protein